MEQILDTPQQSQQNFQYAGFWIRVAAIIIDGILLGIVNFAITSLAAIDVVTSMGLYYAVTTPIGLLYTTLMESSSTQGTVGKMLVGIKVGDADGNKISFLNALGRYLAKIISGLILGIGFMMAGWDPKKQGLHDKIASTYVFYK